MDTVSNPRLAVAGLLTAAALVVALIFMGGQTSQILSTVGGPVTNGGSGGSSGGDTTGDSDPAGGGSGTGTGTGGKVADAAALVPTLLIVRTGTLAMEVPDLGTAMRDADAAVLGAGGYISGSDQTAAADRSSAAITYRIPSAAWDATLDTLRKLGSRVTGEKISTEEVSGQVVDLGARIVNLQTTEAALQAIMAKATKISDILAVQEQLTTTRGEIERLVADKTQLEDRAAFGNLVVTYQVPVAPKPAATPVPAKGWDPGDDVARATANLVKIGERSTSAGIWLAIIGLPLAIGALVVLFVSWQLYRLTRWVIRRRDAAIVPGG